MSQTYNKFFQHNLDVSVLIFAGKGGLGKTTFAAATGLHMAKLGKKVLVFSTDPQASLSDIFERDLFGKGEIEIRPNLCVMEIDADRRIAAYQEEIRERIKEMYGLAEVPPEIEEYIASASAEPAMHESACYDAMVDLVAEGRYDLYIFDMPPFGHGVRIIAMADVLTAWIEKMAESREKSKEYDRVASTMRGGTTEDKATEDAIMEELGEIRDKLSSFTKMLQNKKRTGFFMVLIPEKMAILDTQRALDMFGQFGISLTGILVNMVYPPQLLQYEGLSPYLKNRIIMQQNYMKEIDQIFGKDLKGVCPMFDREPKGLDRLDNVAEALFSWSKE